jgi:ribosomal protein S4
MGILPAGSSLDDVLALETESILSRRLQTLVYLKGLSNTVSHSRQLINHGHILIGERKVTIPSFMVAKDEEKDIGYTDKSPLNELSHPARPKTDVYKTGAPPPKTEKAKEEKKPEKEEAKEEKVTEEPPKEEKPVEKEKSDEETTKSPKEKEEPTEKSKEAEPKEEPVEKPESEESAPAEKQSEEKDKKAEVAKGEGE